MNKNSITKISIGVVLSLIIIISMIFYYQYAKHGQNGQKTDLDVQQVGENKDEKEYGQQAGNTVDRVNDLEETTQDTAQGSSTQENNATSNTHTDDQDNDSRTEQQNITADDVVSLANYKYTLSTYSPYNSKNPISVSVSFKVDKKYRVSPISGDFENGFVVTDRDKNMELRVYSNTEMEENKVFAIYNVLPGSVKIGNIELGGLKQDIYRVAYQTDENIFYTNNYKSTGKCTVASSSVGAPCAWLTISFDTHAFIYASLTCKDHQPKQDCLVFGDNIIKTLQLKYW